MEEIKVGEFQNFNQILEIYKKTLEIIICSTNGKFDTKKIKELSNPKYRFSFATITFINEFAKIENLYESKELDEEIWKSRIEKFNLIPPFSEVKVKGTSDDDKSLKGFMNKFKSIRNCIAHARYYLTIDNEMDTSDDMLKCSIVFDDPTNTVQGKIPFNSIFNLSDKFTFIPKKNNDIRIRMKKVFISVKDTDKFLAECYKNIIVITDNKNSERSLSKEEKDRLKTYSSLTGKIEMKRFFIRFMSKNVNTKNLLDLTFISNFLDLIKKIINYKNISLLNINDFNNYNTLLSTIYAPYYEDMSESLYFEGMLNEDIDENHELYRINLLFKSFLASITKEDMIKFQQEQLYMNRPFLYSEGLISMLNYLVGYIRECNINYDREVFKFKDIDASHIKIEKEDKEEPSIIHLKPGEKKLKEISELEKQKRIKEKRIRERLKFEVSKGGNVYGLLKIADSKSVENNSLIYKKLSELLNFFKLAKQNGFDGLNIDEIISSLDEYILFFNEYNDESNFFPQVMLTNIPKKINELKQLYIEWNSISKELSKQKLNYERIKNNPDYIDYSGLFGHIRNAIVHNNVKVNYDSAKKSKKLEDIEYTFTDYKKNDPNWVTFKATINGKELMYLIEQLQNSINTQVEQSNHNNKFKNFYLHEAIVNLGIGSSELQDKQISDVLNENAVKGSITNDK